MATFTVESTGYVSADGTVVAELPDPCRDPAELIRLYRAMVLTRTFAAKAIALQRTGRLGTYASSLGQDAVGVGVGAAMSADDVLVPSFREQGAQLMRGVPPAQLLLYWGGDERGSDFTGPREDFPICVPIGSHAPHAVGVALALQRRGEARAAVCVFGDGATSKGDVYEAMNYAGFRGEQVDGNDVVAVRTVVAEAIARARRGGGPTLVEIPSPQSGHIAELHGQPGDVIAVGAPLVDFTDGAVADTGAVVGEIPPERPAVPAPPSSPGDLGIAVDTDDGLFVPTLRDVTTRDADDLRRGLYAMRADIATRTIPPEHLKGQTITLSNFGMIGGRNASLVVVPPQVAIVGAGRIREQMVVLHGHPVVTKVLPLSLTFDHRVVTGGEAARFLAAVIADLEAPS